MRRWEDGHEQFVDVGDRRLFARSLGEGDPCVVFESGAGGSGSYWAAVQERVAAVTMTVAYDRAGLGRSDPDPRPRTLARGVADLDVVLDELGVPAYVLVGHSLGGPMVRLAAAARPSSVVGVVLVDPADEDCELYYAPATMRQQAVATAVLRWGARLGVAPIVARRLARNLPAAAATAVARDDATVEAARVLAAETDIIGEFATLRESPPDLGDIPVTVISGTAPARLGARARHTLVQRHRARAESLNNGRHVSASRSGHMIPFTEPDVIADEILQLIREHRP